MLSTQDYKNLKEHCSVKYRIKSKVLEIGKLTDVQLETSEKILSKWNDLNDNQIKQLAAIRYVIQYRQNNSIAKLNSEANAKRLQRGLKIANSIRLWDERIIDNLQK